MTKKKPFTERDRKDAEGPFMDNPERIKTDKESIYDMHEDMKFVDAIPSDGGLFCGGIDCHWFGYGVFRWFHQGNR